MTQPVPPQAQAQQAQAKTQERRKGKIVDTFPNYGGGNASGKGYRHSPGGSGEGNGNFRGIDDPISGGHMDTSTESMKSPSGYSGTVILSMSGGIVSLRGKNLHPNLVFRIFDVKPDSQNGGFNYSISMKDYCTYFNDLSTAKIPLLSAFDIAGCPYIVTDTEVKRLLEIPAT